jgi:hypothetical protein
MNPIEPNRPRVKLRTYGIMARVQFQSGKSTGAS